MKANESPCFKCRRLFPLGQSETLGRLKMLHQKLEASGAAYIFFLDSSQDRKYSVAWSFEIREGET